MTTTPCIALCLAALTAACAEDGRDPAAPESTSSPSAAATVEATTTLPALRLDAHALYYCARGDNRYCMVLHHQVRITSSGAALKWKASKNPSWIALSATAGTTPSTLTISVPAYGLPVLPVVPLKGQVTITAAGASNSPQTIVVEVNGQLPPALALSDSAIGFCYYPTSTRACIKVAEDVQITSTHAALTWRAVPSASWILVHPATGTTPTRLRVSVDLTKVPFHIGTAVTGSITVSSGAAYNTPLTIPVKLQFYNWPLPE